MPCRCASRARRILKRLGFGYKQDGAEYVLQNERVHLKIPIIAVKELHLRVALLALVARLLFPPRP